MQTGTVISGAGHAALILWVILGDWLFTRDEPAAVEVAAVTLMSSAEFEAMVAAAPSTPTPAPEPEPAPEPAPAPEPEPAVEPPPPVVPDLPQPVAEPSPLPEPVPDPTLPENNGVADALPLPVNPDQIPDASLPPSASPRPRPAPRVAPVPVEAPDPAVEIAEAPVEAVTPDPVEAPDVVAPEEPAAAPEEAGTVLETEANRDQVEEASGAPPSSPRPRGRPVQQAADAPEPPTETAAAEPPPEPTPAPSTDTDAVAQALAEALAADIAAAGASDAPQGPPMTGGERDALRVAVQQCWNVGSLSSDALRTTVVVAVSVAQTGVPDAASIRLVEATGGTEAGARGAFEAARRAIIRCGARGFPLPPEKYDQWREMELVFNPDGMRMR